MKTVYIIILIISSLILNISCDNSLGLDNNVQKNPKGEVSDWELYGHAVAPEENENIATTRTTKKLMHERGKGLKYLV